MKLEVLSPRNPEANLKSYQETYQKFRWEDVEKSFSWHTTGKVNMAYEAVDRHAASWRKDKIALYYLDDFREEKYTFQELMLLSNKFADVLRRLGIKKGDRVFVFMPRSPELYIVFLGITKVGAIVGPLFEAFMEEAVKDRLSDSEAIAVITVPAMKNRIPQNNLPSLKHIILVGGVNKLEQGEVSYEKEMALSSEQTDIEWLDRDDPLILHYTSGSTGKPKGVIHIQNAMIGHYQTARWVLDLRDEDIYWCTADPGWVTGTSYGIYGPWLNGVSSLIRGGRFNVDAWYATIEKYKITVWYSAPTAFRMMMAAGDEVVSKYDLSSLRLIYSVGEPLNPEVIRWALKVFGQPIHDTWWMTETGMQMIANYPSLPIKPGSMGKPFPGVTATILDDDGKELPPGQIGNLAVKKGWPSMMREIWKNAEKYRQYFPFSDWYISGDSAYRDEDGYFWFQGRVDDVIKTSGERVGPFEVESKLLEHPAVAEAGVIGKPDSIRGEIIKAFIALNDGFTPSENLKEEISRFVKNGLAAHAVPREIEFRKPLPKTRSGKIMRRVLKAWELGLPTGDLSTMES
ncbi:MAG: acetate--CoA ligase [Deltaproteobacteria bacterium CG1_02_45_11]|nr:MAG: acetate--CoA ligase [Deltaproteobacteria bacterium CG1_02_45_11]